MPEEKTSRKRTKRIPIKFPAGEDRRLLGICMGIALFFWLLVKLSQTYRTEKTVELYFSLPEGKAFSEMPPQDIVATLQGTGWELLYEFLRRSQIGLSYDLRNVQDRFVLSRGQLRSDLLNRLSSGNMSIMELNYDDIVLLLEPKETRRVPVRLLQRFSFEQGYQMLGKPAIAPDSVTLTGPESVLSGFDQWETDSIVLTDLRATVSKSVALRNPPAGVHVTADKVEVKVQVEQFSEQSFWVPVRVRSTADSVRVFPQTIQLTCVVGLSHYDQIDAGDFEIIADLEGLRLQKEQRNTVLLQLTKYPEHVKNIRFSPKSVEFFLVK